MEKKNLIKLTLTIAATLAFVLYLSTPTYKYDIEHPINGKHHGIIKLVKKTIKGDIPGYANCSAYVITDKIAITAGHCITNAASTMKIKHKVLLDRIADLEEEGQIILMELQSCMFMPQCQDRAAYVKEQNALLAQRREELLAAEVDKFDVYNIYGEKITTAIGEYNVNDKKRDHGYITGDFKDFNKIPLRIGYNVKIGDRLRTCGFAGGNTPPICTDMRVTGKSGFFVHGVGYIAQGMSGGPIIDEYGIVVGTVSMSGGEYVFMDPFVGVIDIEFEKPKKK